MATEAEAPAAHNEKETQPELKSFLTQSMKTAHIAVTRGLTRQMPNGDFVKISATLEADVKPSVVFGEMYGQLSAALKGYIDEDFSRETALHADPSKSVREATSTPNQTIQAENPYLNLVFVPSKKRSNLRSLKIDSAVLQNPVAKQLYDFTKMTGNLKVGDKSYRYAKMQDGSEWVFEWSRQQLG